MAGRDVVKHGSQSKGTVPPCEKKLEHLRLIKKKINITVSQNIFQK
jgi:hypothetical protein